VRYEDLIGDPEATIRGICAFIDEPFEPGLLAHDQTAAAKKGAALSESWQNTGGPILSANAGKYRAALSASEIAQVEQAAGAVMDGLGYAREGAPAAAPSVLGWTIIHALDAWWGLKVELRSLTKDANHWRRWQRAILMGWLRWWREEPAR
jgi:hypothetical protein